MYKIGIGYDAHRLEKGEKLILGGVDIKNEFGIIGHSDGDVLVHSMIDAILGASAKGDLGNFFPSDPQWKNYSSLKMLNIIYNNEIKDEFIINHIDSVVILQKPNISSFIEEMRSNIISNLDLDDSGLSIKATTTDYLGFIGQGKGIACQAIATLIKK
tara:strand:+ start:1018 stop:1491 length:474 start_codon:yes stop_codon:yes gene_type:complete